MTSVLHHFEASLLAADLEKIPEATTSLSEVILHYWFIISFVCFKSEGQTSPSFLTALLFPYGRRSLRPIDKDINIGSGGLGLDSRDS